MRACALYTPATARGSKIGGDSGETAFGMLMSFDEKLRRKLEQMLTVVDEREGRDTQGPRLLDDAARLWRRVGNFISMGLVTAEPDYEALELSCMALQFPMRSIKAAAGGKMGPQLWHVGSAPGQSGWQPAAPVERPPLVKLRAAA